MNDLIQPPESPDDDWETAVRETASRFPYPKTPDIADAVRQRLRSRSRHTNPIWRTAAVMLLILLLAVLVVPEARAVVLDFIRIGALRIFPLEPTSTTLPHTPTPRPPGYGQTTPLTSVLEMPGETTLDDARAKSGFVFGLPTYPAGLSAPNHVYLQDRGDPLVTLVWLVPDHPDQVRLTLEIFDERLVASKFASMDGSENVRVKGRSGGLWLPEPSLVVYSFRHTASMLERTVQGSVLIWTDGGLTYRLESDLSKAEAVRVAESLQ